jgi:hypothetical protein
VNRRNESREAMELSVNETVLTLPHDHSPQRTTVSWLTRTLSPADRRSAFSRDVDRDSLSIPNSDSDRDSFKLSVYDFSRGRHFGQRAGVGECETSPFCPEESSGGDC